MYETELNKKNNTIEINKKIFMFMIITLLVVTSAFCQSTDGVQGVNTIKKVFNTIYKFFTSAAVRVICVAGVIFTGIKIITNKGNPEMMKSLIPICIACIIIGSASWFVEQFMGSTNDWSSLGSESWW